MDQLGSDMIPIEWTDKNGKVEKTTVVMYLSLILSDPMAHISKENKEEQKKGVSRSGTNLVHFFCV